MSQETDRAYTVYIKDSGDFRAATLEETLAAARHALKRRFRPGCNPTSPDLVREYLRVRLALMEHEVFAVILDARHRLVAHVDMFRGTLDGTVVHPREVVKEVLKQNVAAVIFVPNHPSGVSEPSNADELITRRGSATHWRW